MRFPYAVCGHVLFVDASAKTRLVPGCTARSSGDWLSCLRESRGRRLPADPNEIYEHLALVLVDPLQGIVEIAPDGVPENLHLRTYFDRMFQCFEQRNPFYGT